jgi:hypothetical protein
VLNVLPLVWTNRQMGFAGVVAGVTGLGYAHYDYAKQLKDAQEQLTKQMRDAEERLDKKLEVWLTRGRRMAGNSVCSLPSYRHGGPTCSSYLGSRFARR